MIVFAPGVSAVLEGATPTRSAFQGHETPCCPLVFITKIECDPTKGHRLRWGSVLLHGALATIRQFVRGRGTRCWTGPGIGSGIG